MKNRFDQDYERVRAGEYRYIGHYYTLPMNKEQKKKSIWINFFFCFSFAAAQLIAGLINADSSRTLWIVLPYCIMFLPAAYMMIGAGTYVSVPLRMEHSAYENSLIRMKRSCIAVMVLAAVNMLLDGVYILIHIKKGIYIAGEMGYLGCMLAVLLIGIGYGMVYDRMYAGIVID